MSVIQFWKAVFCFAFMPLYFGGDKKQTTTNQATNYDQRSVLTDSQNTYDLSNNSTNAWTDARVTSSSYDLSDRSIDSSKTNSDNTTYADLSNRSVSNIDSSNRSINNTMLSDSGAVAGAFGFAKSTADGALASLQNVLGFATGVATGQQASVIHAYDYAGGLFDVALDAVNRNDGRAYDAFDRAAVISRDALAMSAAQSKDVLSQVQNAYADAKGTTQASQKMIFAVLAVAGVAILAMKKG